MPVPFILGGLAAAAGIIGVGGHLSAKETNEEAERVANDARKLYDDAKNSLEQAQKRTEASLLDLGYAKKDVLEGSMNQFLIAFKRVKNIEIRNSSGLNELSKFMIDEQESLQIKEMSDIYQSTFSSGAAGAATGAVIALAASGSLPVVTGTLGTAGAALMAGEVGIATGLAGSALSFGAAMTPLAAIAAPVVLFTGISSSIKADENLEKAQTMYAQADAAAEKMRVAELICVGISDKAEMFEELLFELNEMFSRCTMLLDSVTRKKAGIISKRADFNKFSEDEKKLLAITRSLAGAVKAVIDTPILDEDGDISEAAEETYLTISEGLEKFNTQVQYIESYNLKAKPIQQKTVRKDKPRSLYKYRIFDAVRNIFAPVIALFFMVIGFGISGESLLVANLTFTISLLLLMNTRTEFKIFRFVRNIAYLALIAEFGMVLYKYAPIWTSSKYFWIGDILVLFISAYMLEMSYPKNDRKASNLRKLFGRIMMCAMLFSLGLPIFKISWGWIGLSFNTSMIVLEILFAIFALGSMYKNEQLDN